MQVAAMRVLSAKDESMNTLSLILYILYLHWLIEASTRDISMLQQFSFRSCIHYSVLQCTAASALP